MPQQLTVQELAEKLESEESLLLLDVRQEWEHQTARLPNSLLIPLDQLMARVEEIQPEPEQPLVIYCHHGLRSQSAAHLLEHLGYQNVYNLQGGIDAWSLLVDPTLPRY